MVAGGSFNSIRASIGMASHGTRPLCRFLIDAFGREALGRGSGVLDIGGGRGELSFELLNLNNIRATIVDPRPASLHKQAKWLRVTGLQACLHACLITSDLHSHMCTTTRHAAFTASSVVMARCACLAIAHAYVHMLTCQYAHCCTMLVIAFSDIVPCSADRVLSPQQHLSSTSGHATEPFCHRGASDAMQRPLGTHR